MSDEKHLYDAFQDPPIPTYEEATSSHPLSRLGPQETSDDAERQGLLGHDLAAESNSRRRNGYYHPPSVQSVDDDDDEDSGLGSPVRASDDAELRLEMEEMDILDPESAEDGRSRRNRGRFSKRFHIITSSLSNFNLSRIPWPSFGFEWLTSRVPSIPDEYRPGWALIARLMGLILIISLVYFLVVSEVMPYGTGGFGQPFNPEWVRQQALQNVDSRRIQDNLQYITSFDHVGGTEGSYVLGQWIEGQFKTSNMDTYTHDEYFVYMNYPKEGGRRVAIVDPPDKAWEAKLEENPQVHKAMTAAFHGLSASGNVTGPLIYANYGDAKDFKRLKDGEIKVEGAIVLMRYYGTQPDRAMKVKAAQDAGAAGVLIYSDPADDGFVKGKAVPYGRWRPEDSVQRGSVALTHMIAGDVLTPGRPSTKDEERMSKDKNPALPKIPSMPLSWRDAQKLLQSLKGIGEELPADWVGGVPDVGQKWFSGHHDSSPKVNLRNEQDEVEKQPITNVFGSFVGIEDKAKKIIIGNHRDSWCFGAADPGSGTAVMLEVARVLGLLRAQGWRPLRTIEFASWDAEEYNMIGSTEHVEANMDELRANAIAYINVDVGVTGDKIWANGSPIFQTAWLRILDRLMDPHQNVTLKELWERDNMRMGALGATSDYVAFQDMAGTSSIEFGFSGPEHGDMKHSCYESFEWLKQHIDPDFTYHNLLAQIWALLILELAQEPIMPLKLNDYAVSLQEEVQNLMSWTETKGSSSYDIAMFQPLVDALTVFATRAEEFHQWDTFWYNQVYGTGGFETQAVTLQRVAHNAKMGLLETHLLDLPWDDGDKEAHGLPGRDQYKHVVFAPSPADSAKASIFPFVRDAIEHGDWGLAAAQINKTARILERASARLLA